MEGVGVVTGVWSMGEYGGGVWRCEEVSPHTSALHYGHRRTDTLAGWERRWKLLTKIFSSLYLDIFLKMLKGHALAEKAGASHPCLY